LSEGAAEEKRKGERGRGLGLFSLHLLLQHGAWRSASTEKRKEEKKKGENVEHSAHSIFFLTLLWNSANKRGRREERGSAWRLSIFFFTDVASFAEACWKKRGGKRESTFLLLFPIFFLSGGEKKEKGRENCLAYNHLTPISRTWIELDSEKGGGGKEGKRER